MRIGDIFKSKSPNAVCKIIKNTDAVNKIGSVKATKTERNAIIRGDAKMRVVRVFISSTFRDMKEERNILVKKVFPKLRLMCEERGVVWGEVDLRWGVTDEQVAEGKVLPICLEEIKHCRPYFIGLLGERYGWVPDKISPELIKSEPWLEKHRSKSVTELEILHGVLEDKDMEKHAFFYFRDPEYINRLPEKSFLLDFVSENEIAADKLRQLKWEIEASPFPVRKNYLNPEELGKLVERDFETLIDGLYPKEENIDPLDREAMQHDIFARSRAEVYIGRKEYFERLNHHVNSSEAPLVVIGESGSGKSALMANWANQYKSDHTKDVIITHFIGASSQSADWASMLRRIMGELKRHFNIHQEIPDEVKELRPAFANWLHMGAAKGRAVIIIDALNQLEDRDGALDLVWLPPVIPDNIRLVLSSLPGRSLGELKNRDWKTMEIMPLAEEERGVFIASYLAQYTKTLEKPRATKIARSRQAANPLYLKVLLEELRLFGEYERLEERVEHYLEAETPQDLYHKVMERWEEDYEGDSDMVGDSLSLMWASRHGLSENELRELLGDKEGPLPQAVWAPLFLAARESFVSRSGLLNFGHDYLRAAVQEAYLPGEKQQKSMHARLYKYWEGKEWTKRVAEEYPWQIYRAQNWSKLYTVLSDLDTLSFVWNLNKYDVKEYWTQLEANGLSLKTAFKDEIDYPSKILNKETLYQLARLLAHFGYLEEASIINHSLAKHFLDIGDIAHLFDSIGAQAEILSTWDRLEEAMTLYEKQEQFARTLNNKDDLQVSIGNQADVLRKRGRLNEAMIKHKEQERVCREINNMDSLQYSLGGQALILKEWGKLDEAWTLLKEKDLICREIGNMEHLLMSINTQALILHDWGRFEEAMERHKEVECICRKLGDNAILSASLHNQALIYKYWGELDQAMNLYKESEKLCRKFRDGNSLRMSLNGQALILLEAGRHNEALVVFSESEYLCRKLNNLDGLHNTLLNKAVILMEMEQFNDAMLLLKESEQLCRDANLVEGLSCSLGNQAVILFKMKKFDESLKLHREEEELCLKIKDKDGLQHSLGNQANVFVAKGMGNKAMELYKRQERLCREMNNNKELATSLSNQAALLVNEYDNFDDALPLFEEAYRLVQKHNYANLIPQIKSYLQYVREKVENPYKETRMQSPFRNEVYDSALQKADIFHKEGRSEEALELLKEQENLMRKHNNCEALGEILGCQARILADLDRIGEAMPLLAEQKQLYRKN